MPRGSNESVSNKRVIDRAVIIVIGRRFVTVCLSSFDLRRPWKYQMSPCVQVIVVFVHSLVRRADCVGQRLE